MDVEKILIGLVNGADWCSDGCMVDMLQFFTRESI